MGDKEINIKSSTIEKGLEFAKDFLAKLMGPTVDEVGLLIADQIKFLRFKNQVKILLKAKKYVELHNIAIKEVPIKILVPLLENASLEENEDLQEKWISMIVNMVDSENNLQNHIFPYLLSQISIDEYKELKLLDQNEQAHIDAKKQLSIALRGHSKEEKAVVDKIRNQVDRREQEGFALDLNQFEVSNLIRLGLIRQLPPKIYIEEFKTGLETNMKFKNNGIQLMLNMILKSMAIELPNLVKGLFLSANLNIQMPLNKIN